MARSHLTLAALATSAVAGLDIAGAQPFGSPGGDFDAAILTGQDGRHWIIRVPRSERAEQEQSADLIALRALSAGVRARLPFTVSTFAGQVPIDGTRAVVSEFVYGAKVPLASFTTEYAASVGEAIAAIHALPTSFVVDAGLPAHSPVDTLALLPWAREEVFSFVLFYRQGLDQQAQRVVGEWTRELVEATLKHEGRYYLPYQLHATKEQFERAYPEVAQLRQLKSRVDPQGRFSNSLWQKYL